MKRLFVQTSNVNRFLAAINDVEQRAAPEASITLVSGDAGFGKSRTSQWWALHNDAVFIRVKAACTPHWILTDLVKELGEQAPAYSCENLFGQALGVLAKNPRPLVIDEVEHTLKNDIRALEILRDLSDMAEVQLVLSGREFVLGTLKRHKQLYTRISGHAEFGPATLADVKLCVDKLCDVPVAPEVIEKIHHDCEGHIREVIKGIANVERAGARNKGKTVTLEVIGERPLCQDWRKKSSRAA